MARIRKEDHARILQLVDIERRTVREIAAEFGCTPAAIYSLLTKLRRETRGAAPEPGESQPPLALDDDMDEAMDAVVPNPPAPFARPPVSEESRVVTFERPAPAPAREAAPSPAPRPAPSSAPRPAPSSAPRPASATIGAKLAKPGTGLIMRTADGEETMTPFRSIDDLLSAIKPILRAGARSAEPVWFSLQPVDLSTIDMDAA
jgi:transposase-like protein